MILRTIFPAFQHNAHRQLDLWRSLLRPGLGGGFPEHVRVRLEHGFLGHEEDLVVLFNFSCCHEADAPAWEDRWFDVVDLDAAGGAPLREEIMFVGLCILN